MSNEKAMKPVEILLVEDNDGDIRLTERAFKKGKLLSNLRIVKDGVEALEYLRHEGAYAHSDLPPPDLILLDLNLPKLDGREALATIKNDNRLSHIPVIVLTSSKAEEDVCRSYKLHASCYIQKPVDWKQFTDVITTLEEFWFNIVRLPGRSDST